MEDHIGVRIAYWRKRRGGMSQAVLAGLAGVSQPYISKVEAGIKGIERRSTLVAIAAALQVSVADLLGQPGDPTDPLKEGAAAAVPQIRVALAEIEYGERRVPTCNAEQAAADLQHVLELRAQARYATVAGLLPRLLFDAAAHGPRSLTQVALEAAICLRYLGYRDLALPAARVGVVAAEETGDPALLGAAWYRYTLMLPAEAPGLSARAAERSLAELQHGAADPQVRQMLGQLHLSASLACAVDGRGDDAAAHLAEAGKEAATLGDPEDGKGFNMLCFGPTNVGLWRMAVAIELGEHGRTVEVAGAISPQPLRIADRHYAYYLDLGRALAHSSPSDGAALAAFMRAERAAPLVFSLNPLARDAVMSMVYRARRRSVSRELRTLARRVGVEVPA
jgi:transcriptional regulator with XRE-family HTH domain